MQRVSGEGGTIAHFWSAGVCLYTTRHCKARTEHTKLTPLFTTVVTTLPARSSDCTKSLSMSVFKKSMRPTPAMVATCEAWGSDTSQRGDRAGERSSVSPTLLHAYPCCVSTSHTVWTTARAGDAVSSANWARGCIHQHARTMVSVYTVVRGRCKMAVKEMQKCRRCNGSERDAASTAETQRERMHHTRTHTNTHTNRLSYLAYNSS